MPNWAISYVKGVEAVNYRLGRIAMYLLFAIMAILLWSSVTKFAKIPALWTLEMAQFTLVAYYLLGAPYSMQLGANVRMDLLYARLPVKRQAAWDIFTIFCLLFYLGVMLWGAVDSTIYAFAYNERSPTAWRPYMWPIKLILCLGFFLMILQSLAFFFRDIAKLRGETI